jgi:hypothetical protein
MYHRLIAAAGCNGDMRGVTAMLQEMRKTYAPNESVSIFNHVLCLLVTREAREGRKRREY